MANSIAKILIHKASRVAAGATKTFKVLKNKINLQVFKHPKSGTSIINNNITTPLSEFNNLISANKIDLALHRVFDRNSIHTLVKTGNYNKLKNLMQNSPKIKADTKLGKLKLNKKPAIPKTEKEFLSLGKSNSTVGKLSDAVKKNINTKRIIAGVAIATPILGTIFATIHAHSKNSSGCFEFSVDAVGELKSCKLLSRSCSCLSLPSNQKPCLEKSPNPQICRDKPNDCCTDCIIADEIDDDDDESDDNNSNKILPGEVYRKCVELDFFDSLVDISGSLGQNILSGIPKLFGDMFTTMKYVGIAIIVFVVIYLIKQLFFK